MHVLNWVHTLVLVYVCNNGPVMSLFTRFKSATFDSWVKGGFSTPRLVEDPGENALAELKLSPELVKALTYNLHFASCRERLTAIIRDQWLETYLASNVLSDVALDLCLCIAESGIELESVQETLWSHLAGNIESEPYKHAFCRIFTLYPYNYDLETFLVECGYTEILESVDRLESEEEIRFYLERLDKDQLERLYEETKSQSIDAVIEKTRPRSWPLGRVVSKALPIDPPSFCCAESLWQWHADFLSERGTDEECKLWDQLKDSAGSVLTLWNDQLTPITVLPERSTMMILTSDDSAKFYMKFGNEYKHYEEMARNLRETAGDVDPVFGKSLKAASVLYRRDDKKDELRLCQRLDPLDTLTSNYECTRYLLNYGADLSVISIDRALSLSNPETPLSSSSICYIPIHILEDPYIRTKVLGLSMLRRYITFGVLEKPLSLPSADKRAVWFVMWD